jgi:hypothetical protein
MAGTMPPPLPLKRSQRLPISIETALQRKHVPADASGSTPGQLLETVNRH